MLCKAQAKRGHHNIQCGAGPRPQEELTKINGTGLVEIVSIFCRENDWLLRGCL